MTDSANPSSYCLQWDEYAQWLRKFQLKSTETSAHIWSDEAKLRERMNDIEKALVGAGVK